MSPFLAIAAYAGLLAAFAAPLGLLLWRPGAGGAVAALYAAFLLSLSGYQSGLFQSASLPPLDNLGTASTTVSTQQCAELLRLLDSAGVILDRRRPPRLAVAGPRWEQVPQEGRDAVVACVERGWPAGAGPAQVEVRAN